MDAPMACARPSRAHPEGRTGTPAGYDAHRTANEPTCQACRTALAAARRASRKPTGRPRGRPRATPEHRREVTRLARARWRAANPERTRELSRQSDARRDPARRRATGRRTQQRRRQQFDTLKARPCMDCGVQYPPYVMQFDHRNSAEKAFSISRVITRAWAATLAEVEKCDLVCANCHAERTWGPGYRARNGA